MSGRSSTPSKDATTAASTTTELDKILEAQAQEPDPVKRMVLVREAVLLIQDKAWNLAIWRGTGISPYKNYVKGYAPKWQVGWRQFRDTWLDK